MGHGRAQVVMAGTIGNVLPKYLFQSMCHLPPPPPVSSLFRTASNAHINFTACHTPSSLPPAATDPRLLRTRRPTHPHSPLRIPLFIRSFAELRRANILSILLTSTGDVGDRSWLVSTAALLSVGIWRGAADMPVLLVTCYLRVQ